jgi:phosphoribosyl 1,2-cyclic phosphodiesterase
LHDAPGEMYVQGFGSGSCGNALLVQSGSTSVLIDCGVSPRAIEKPLASRNLRLSELDAILLTHEHDDHVRGLGTASSLGLPLFATQGTSTALGLKSRLRRAISFDEPMQIGTLTIQAIQTSHDASEPCGYSITDGASRMTLLTDLGETDDSCGELIEQSHLIVIEANHDVQMLRSGPYPEHLKRRVLSARGHLSNDACGTFLARCFGRSTPTRTIWLAHLSATNNRPALAVRSVESVLAQSKTGHKVAALPRREIGPVWQPSLVTSSFMQLGLFG